MSPDTAATRLKREEIIHLVAQHLVTRGFENSGIRALAESVGISDRMLMYYFEKKEDLIAQALLLLAEGMTASLDELIPQNRASVRQIVNALTAIDNQNDLQRGVLMLWFEIIGLAVRGGDPYRATAKQILEGYEAWIANKLPPDQKHRATETLAQIEGQIMLDLLAHPRESDNIASPT